MSESHPSPKGLRQPALQLPESTGNPVTDKANRWFFSAQWRANQVAREEDGRIAEELGLPRPEATHMPDFNDDHSELLTTIANTLGSRGTQQMLATFEDVRQATLNYGHGVDILPQQMQMLQAVFANPDLK